MSSWKYLSDMPQTFERNWSGTLLDFRSMVYLIWRWEGPQWINRQCTKQCTYRCFLLQKETVKFVIHKINRSKKLSGIVVLHSAMFTYIVGKKRKELFCHMAWQTTLTTDCIHVLLHFRFYKRGPRRSCPRTWLVRKVVEDNLPCLPKYDFWIPHPQKHARAIFRVIGSNRFSKIIIS